MKENIKHLCLAIILLVCGLSSRAEVFTLSGTVIDARDSELLSYANLIVFESEELNTRVAIVTDEDGRFAMRLPQGKYTIKATYVGYKSLEKNINLDKDMQITIALEQSDMMLNEIVVTSRESQGLTSGSRIDRDAMQHLQPSSFTDILELMPGNISQDPNMGSANTITLRETGAVSATGKKTDTSDDYAITSLGTSFVVDGTPINNDASLQGIPDPTSGSAESRRSTLNRGIDMRTLSTDNIESVDIIRGIPSAEYGNLTSGVVNIKRIRKATPLTARFKADEYSKLFSAGKGFGVSGHDHIINLDISWLDSKVDPRDNLENYKRLTASSRGNFQWDSPQASVSLNIGADFTGSFDNAKVDPDLNFNKVDIFKSMYHRYALTSELTINFKKDYIFNNIAINASTSLVSDVTERTKQVAPQRASVAPTTVEEGVHDGVYLLREYIADFRSESMPLSVFAKAKAGGSTAIDFWLNDYKLGVEWTLTKNNGAGQIYDPMRPLSAGWTTRPRAFTDIPSLSTLSFFAEDMSTLTLGNNKLQILAGIRGISLPVLESRYDISGRVYLDPRFNAEWVLPSFSIANYDATIRIAGGLGLTTRMPTVDYLFPQVHYADMIQLNYYDVNNPENSRINLRTYVEDATNNSLRAARNRKYEVRIGMEWGANRLSVTYFDERMIDGFRYSSVYTPRYFRRYDASAIDPLIVQTLEDLPYEDRYVLDGMRRVTNGSRIDKHGVEFQLNTARWNALHTSLIVSGAWLRTRYSNSQKFFYPVNDVVGNRPVSDFYVGIYDSDEGRINEQFNTNFMFDTQIPRWGLTFTSTVQCMWYIKSTRMRENGVPVEYIATDGNIYQYTADSQKDIMLQYLVRHFNDDAFNTFTVPLGIYFNLKATKQIGRWLKLSAFVNRIFDYQPDYYNNGIQIRRSADAYFGMEATITI